MIDRQRFTRWFRRDHRAGSGWLLVCLGLVLAPALSGADPSQPTSTGTPIPVGTEDDEIQMWYAPWGGGSIVTDGNIGLGGTIGQLTSSLPDDSTDVWVASGFWAGVDLSDSTDADVPVLDITDAPIGGFSLSPAYPNPSHGMTYLEWAVPHTARLRLTVHDIEGREVAVVADGPYEPGRYHITWNMARRGMSAGLYFLRLETPEGVFTRRVVMTR